MMQFLFIIFIFPFNLLLMNFVNFLTSGLTIFNFNLQNSSTFLGSMLPNQQQTYQEEAIFLKQKPNDIDYGGISTDIVHSGYGSLQQSIISNFQYNTFLMYQQNAINQELKMNIETLNQKVQNHKKQQNDHSEKRLQVLSSKNKKIKKLNSNCGHQDLQHYAKGMCNNCYHRYGRTKKPWKCSHQILYANGMCQNCYSNKYQKTKRKTRTPYNSIKTELSESKTKPKIQPSS